VAASRTPSNEKLIASNKKAFHEFHVLDKFEAGLELTGTEVDVVAVYVA
jgi:tmRNA-binding protein